MMGQKIVIKDPYIRAFHQARNLVEFLRMVNEITPVGDEVSVYLITGSDQETLEKQVENNTDILRENGEVLAEIRADVRTHLRDQAR